MRRYHLILTLILVFLYTEKVSAQDVDTIEQKPKTLILPLVFYLPETRWGFGITGVSNFRPSKNKMCRPSQIQFGMVYTLNKQWLFLLPFQVYWDEDKYKFAGEIAYYRFLYNFYGIGDQSRGEDLEKYFVNYPRIRLSSVRQINSYTWIGLKYGYDKLNFTQFDSLGVLRTGEILGVEDANYNAFSAAIEWDTRDRIYFPNKGFRAEVEYRQIADWIGSDYNFSKFNIDASYFKSIRENHVLALNWQSSFSHGEVPFFYLNYIGNAKNARGYPDRRYMDRHMITMQVEYRFPFIWKLNGVAFGSLSTLSHDIDRLIFKSKIFPAGGFGLRYAIEKKDALNLRLDFAFTPKDFNFYFTIGEAF